MCPPKPTDNILQYKHDSRVFQMLGIVFGSYAIAHILKVDRPEMIALGALPVAILLDHIENAHYLTNPDDDDSVMV